MQVKLFGPNLRDQRKGQFHVHTADCGDCKYYGPGTKHGGDDNGWKLDVNSRFEVSAELNVDILSDYGLTEEDAEGKELLNSWLSDIWFAPCIKELS